MAKKIPKRYSDEVRAADLGITVAELQARYNEAGRRSVGAPCAAHGRNIAMDYPSAEFVHEDDETVCP